MRESAVCTFFRDVGRLYALHGEVGSGTLEISGLHVALGSRVLPGLASMRLYYKLLIYVPLPSDVNVHEEFKF